MANSPVFVATDLSSGSDEALRQAHEEAQAANAPLVVCHAVRSLSGVNMLFPQQNAPVAVEVADFVAKMKEAVSLQVGRVTRRSIEAFEVVVEEGSPHAVIVNQAEARDAHLIVVGGTGEGALSRALLGTTAEKVVRHAHASVLVARPAVPGGHVLVGTDFSETAEPALAAAVAEAPRIGALLSVCYATGSARPPGGSAPSQGVVDQVVKEADAKLAETMARLGAPGARRHVVRDEPVRAIVELAEKLPAELVVVGTRGLTGLKRMLLGSVAEGVVRNAPCSVLVVR